MKLGAHVSVAGGVDQAVDRAVILGCNTFQIFISNPRGWKPTIITDKQIDLFREKYAKADMQDAVGHSIYLINLASQNDTLRDQSIESLTTGLIYAERLGLGGLVTHIGSRHDMTPEAGIVRVVEALELVLDSAPGKSPILLENTAGAGNLVGSSFKEIGEIIKRVGSDRIGFCLDTAHTFENGYPLHTKEGLEAVISEIENFIGLDRLKAIHLNDSMTEFDSHRDRHQTYGEGFIGEESLTRIITHPKLKDKPFIMETPEFKGGEAGKEVVSKVRKLGEA